MAEQYKVDGIVSEIVRFCTYNGWDKFDLKKQMASAASRSWSSIWSTATRRERRCKIRAEAFMEMLNARHSAGQLAGRPLRKRTVAS